MWPLIRATFLPLRTVINWPGITVSKCALLRPIAERNVSWKLNDLLVKTTTTTGCFVEALTSRLVLIKYSVFRGGSWNQSLLKRELIRRELLPGHAIADCPAAYLDSIEFVGPPREPPQEPWSPHFAGCYAIVPFVRNSLLQFVNWCSSDTCWQRKMYVMEAIRKKLLSNIPYERKQK